MSQEKLNPLVLFQQSEVDAVLMYQKLSEIAKDEQLKETFKKAAADEGRHAAILRSFTGEALKPKPTLAFAVSSMARVTGIRFILKFISEFEYAAGKKYLPFVKDYPEIAGIIKDEGVHGDIMNREYLRLRKKK